MVGRDLAAYLAHHLRTATLRKLATAWGLTDPDSVINVIRRVQPAPSSSKTKALELEEFDEMHRKQASPPSLAYRN